MTLLAAHWFAVTFDTSRGMHDVKQTSGKFLSF